MKRARVSARKKRTLGTKGSNENCTNTSSNFYKNNNTINRKTDKYIGKEQYPERIEKIMWSLKNNIWSINNIKCISRSTTSTM